MRSKALIRIVKQSNKLTRTLRHPALTPSCFLTSFITLFLVITATAQAAGSPPFVVLAEESVRIREGSTVVSGDIGANLPNQGPLLGGGKVEIDRDVILLDPTSSVRADRVEIDGGAQVYDVHYNSLEAEGVILGTQVTPLSLPLTTLPQVPVFSQGMLDFEAPEDSNLPIAAGSYEDFTVRSGATVTFTGGVYDFKSWSLHKTAKIHFEAPTEIRIAERLSASESVFIGPSPTISEITAADIKIIVTGINGLLGGAGEVPKATSFGRMSSVQANVYVPNGTLLVGDSSMIKGAFLGKWIDVGRSVALTHEAARFTSSMTVPRSGHAATLLPDGAILITGGQNGTLSLTSAERLDLLSLTFSPLISNLATARSGHTASALADQMHLLLAGENGGGTLTLAELYNPGTGLFSNILDTLSIPRAGQTATVLLDGRVLIIGGQGPTAADSSEVFDAQSVILFKPSFDPPEGSFILLPNLLSTSRRNHTATLLPDGSVLILGGENDLGLLGSAELFDPTTETFTPLTALMTTPRAGHTANLLPDGRVLLLGGRGTAGFLDTAEIFDPVTGTFSPATPGLITPSAEHTATFLPFGEILITGGENTTGTFSATSLYDPKLVDATPPAVVALSLSAGATDVDLTEVIGLRFSEPMDITTLTEVNVSLMGGGSPANVTIGASEEGLLAFVVPTTKLTDGTTYTLTLSPAITDTSGNPLVSFSSTFTTVAAPVITTLTPNHGQVGQSVTITGQNFDPSAPTLNVVSFGEVKALVTLATVTLLEVSVPSGVPTGVGTLTVTTRGGTASTPFTVDSPVPVLTSLSPGTVSAGSADFTLTLNGSNFLATSTVQFGATTLTSTLISSSQLQVTVPASAIASPGTVQVTVVNPAPNGGTSNALAFDVIGPVIQSFTPTSGPVGTPVTIAGLNFDPVASNNQLSFNGISAIITSATTTEIKTTVPQGATTGPISLTTPAGTATSTPFTVDLSQDFSLNLLPATAGLVAGSHRFISIGATGINGFTDWISLSTNPLPTGISMLFLPSQVTPGGLASVEILADATTVPGTYPVTFIGTAQIDGQTITRSAILSLQILSGGATTLSGQVFNTNNAPIPGTTVSLGANITTTDEAGRFFLENVPVGQQILLVDGRTATAPSTFYPEVEAITDIVSGVGNVLPFIIYLPEINTAHPIDLPVDVTGTTTVAVTATTPLIPGLEVNIPIGTQIIDPDGNPVSQITITPVPPDRAPMPLPPGIDAPLLFTIQPGGSSLSQPVPITFPNLNNALPGERADFYFFDVISQDWAIYGQGTISPDGRQIVPDPGVGLPRFAWHFPAPSIVVQVPDPTPAPAGPSAGDPVDMATGLFTLSKTDMVIPGRIPIGLTRHYHSGNTFVGAFGIGTGHQLDPRLVFVGAGEGQLVLTRGDDSRMPFSLNTDGTYTNSTNPSMAGARITLFGSQRILRFKEGTRWIFGTNGRLVRQEDQNENALTFDRDGAGKLFSVGEENGRRITFLYSGVAPDLIESVTDPLGRTVQYGYDALQRLISVTDPAGGITQYGYDAQNRMTTLTDARGITFLQNTYDVNSRVVQQVNADGGIYQFQYFGPNGVPAISAPQPLPLNPPCGTGPSITISAGDSVPAGACQVIVILVPGPASRLVTQSLATDPEGHTTGYRFNGQGYLIEETRPNGAVIRHERAIGTNQLLSTIDPLGRKRTLAYDGSNNVTSTTDPEGNVTTFTYEPTFNRVATITDPLLQVTSFTYDLKGNLLTTTDPSGATTTIIYNPEGQPLTVTDPLGNVTQFTYDPNGNLITTTDPLANTSERTYDSVSRLLTVSDPRGRTSGFDYDSLNRVIGITDPANGLTQFAYDPNGNLLTVTDANNHATTYTYDVQDRLETRTDPLLRIESYAYDLNGNLKTFTDRKVQVSQFSYDQENRRIDATYADGTTSLFFYDSIGRLIETSDSVGGVIQFGYDNLNRLVSELTSQGIVTYTYDLLGRRSSMAVNGQVPVGYLYDAVSRLTQVAQGVQIVGLGYDTVGRRTTLSYPNGTSTSYAYDAASRITNITHKAGVTPFESLTYTYDAAGNRISLDRTNGASVLLPDTVQAAYDAANEQVRFNSATPNLNYDANGNLIGQTDASGTTTYTWDARNRLVGISGPGMTASFIYDAIERRMSKTINGVKTDYQYDGDDIVAEIGGGAVGALYLRSLNIDEPFVRQSSGNEYYHVDALGSTMSLSDGTGSVQTTYEYGAFGKTVVNGTSINPFQYTGRENDGIGHYYYRARYYSPQLERFINEDPIRFFGGDLNLYNYARRTPLIRKDPSGLIGLGPAALLGCSLGGTSGALGARKNTLVGGAVGGLTGCVFSPLISVVPRGPLGGVLGTFFGAVSGGVTAAAGGGGGLDLAIGAISGAVGGGVGGFIGGGTGAAIGTGFTVALGNQITDAIAEQR